MKKYLSLLSLLFPFCLNAQTMPDPDTNDNRSLLWVIKGKDMKKPSYLFGTIHLLCPEDIIWTAAMKKSLKASQQVCFEMDMDDPSVMMQVAMGMVDKSGISLRDYFTEEQYAGSRKVCQGQPRNEPDDVSANEACSPAKPVCHQGYFLRQPCLLRDQYPGNSKKTKKEITGLEDPEEQLVFSMAFWQTAWWSN